MKVKHQGVMRGDEKEFLDLFQKLCYSRSSWQVWADLMCVMACSISNAVDLVPTHQEPREKEYAECIKRLGSVEIASQLFAIVVMALEKNPEQDFLGEMYMRLNLGNHWKGQFFTPYCVCKAMSEITVGNASEQIDSKGYVSVCDPDCGAGATLIAAANTFASERKDYQSHVLFVGQDIDRVTGMMCYIQLSLLGCAGYVCIGNSLTNPLTGHVLFPAERKGQELWFTPIFHSQVWTFRRLFNSSIFGSGTVTTQKTVEKEQFTYFFDFEQEELA